MHGPFRHGVQALTLASLLFTMAKNAIFARERTTPFVLYLDELQNLVSQSTDVETVLSEARKFGVGICAANQYLDQYPVSMRAAIFAARTHAFFQLSTVDAGNSGIACVIPESLPEANCSDLVILRPAPELIPEFACIYLNSNVGRAHVNAVKVGIAQGHFNVGSMKTTLLPLPPTSEQQEIASRVENLFALANKIEGRYWAAKKQVDGLTQSILAKAFRGELVPTEAELAASEGRDYETAEMLLERVQSRKMDQPCLKEARPKRRRKQGIGTV